MRAHVDIGWLTAVFCLGLPALAAANEDEPTAWHHRPNRDAVRGLIVKMRADATGQALTTGSGALARMSARAGLSLRHERVMSWNAHVLRLQRWLNLEQAVALAHELARDPEVEFATPDYIVYPQLVPNDTDYGSQWHMKRPGAPDNEVAGANLPAAWDVTTGDPNLVIAVLDSGLVPHADLGTIIPSDCTTVSGRILPGYNMITDPVSAGNAAGRGCDPTDLGDYSTGPSTAECGGGNASSSWHGTHVTGILAATGNNGIFVAGVNWQSKILPVRVLGKCGSPTSDIADAIRWAAGLSVPNVNTNIYPAKVINMSLGCSPTACSCDATWQQAINDAASTGAIIVVASGNSIPATNAAGYAPGNCNNVITVAAVARTGALGYVNSGPYSNYGSPTVTIAAPGGNTDSLGAWHPDGVYSTLNGGTTSPAPSPGGDIDAWDIGTSMATPHVAGIVSLILSVNPALATNLTTDASGTYNSVASVRTVLRSTARVFPTVSMYQCTSAASDTAHHYCGAGMVDAGEAVGAALPPVADAGPDQSVQVGSLVTLAGAASAAYTTAFTYQWIQTAGSSVSLSDATSPTPEFTAPNELTTLTFQLTVTDSVSLTGTAVVSVDVRNNQNAPPQGCGCRSASVPTLAALGIFAVALSLRRRRSVQF